METKGLLKSKGILGGVIALLPILDTVLVNFGVFSSPVLADAGAELMTSIGVFVSMWGRIAANKTIKGWF